MVIMLFIFTILLFPIRLNAKVYLKPEEEIIYIKLFLYKFFISDLKIFIFNNEINYKIGKSKPKVFKFTVPFEQNNNQLDYFKIKRIDVLIYLGINTFISTFGSLILKFISQIVSDNSKISTNVRVLPIYFSNSLHLKGKVGLSTNILKILSALLVNLISNILKQRKENKNAIQ